MKLLAIAFLFTAALSAQVGGGCSMGSVPPCVDVSPEDSFWVYYCEWIVRLDGSIQLLPGRPVKPDQGRYQGSGHHPHLGNPLPPSPLLKYTAVNGTAVDSAGNFITKQDGCAYWNVKMNGFAGNYVIAGTGTIGGTHLLNSYAHFQVAPGVNQIGQVPRTVNMQPYEDYNDFTHGPGSGISDTFWTRTFMHNKVAQVAASFKLLTGQNLRLFRCGLPEGGRSDNDRGENFDIVPALWHNSIRGGEQHNSMNACDILNPAFNPVPDGSSPYDFGAADSLADSIEIGGCGVGPWAVGAIGTEGVGSAPVEWDSYWKTKHNIHMICGSEAHNLE